jgi:hypothetical protein
MKKIFKNEKDKKFYTGVFIINPLASLPGVGAVLFLMYLFGIKIISIIGLGTLSVMVLINIYLIFVLHKHIYKSDSANKISPGYKGRNPKSGEIKAPKSIKKFWIRAIVVNITLFGLGHTILMAKVPIRFVGISFRYVNIAFIVFAIASVFLGQMYKNALIKRKVRSFSDEENRSTLPENIYNIASLVACALILGVSMLGFLLFLANRDIFVFTLVLLITTIGVIMTRP